MVLSDKWLLLNSAQGKQVMKTLPFENLKLHVIVWAIFITYEMLIIQSTYGDAGGFGDNFIPYLINISIFYFTAHLLLPNTMAYSKNPFLKLPVVLLGILVAVVIFVALKFAWLNVANLYHIKIHPAFTNFQAFISTNIFRGIYFIGLSAGYWFALSTVQNRKKIADLETLQLKTALQTQALEKTLLTTENAYLKSQINPHFLLNTLNFLYNSVSKFSETIADSVMTLADIMRYALTNADEDGRVDLAMEIEHIHNFIKLNQARFSQRLCFDMEVQGDTDGLRIIPLVLITLAENVFKYGDLLDEKHPAKITAYIEGDHLTFITQNHKKKKAAEPGHGIGIQNIKNRLATYHPHYELIVEDSEQEYRSILKIQL